MSNSRARARIDHCLFGEFMFQQSIPAHAESLSFAEKAQGDMREITKSRAVAIVQEQAM